ncbi:MAG: tRNA (N(6)-L-threonylcarbamoyladenosine(37)-C(2))-methylthiotransferase [Candidatus Diapherotrites archaeon]
MVNKFFVEGYGCSMNLAETEQIMGFLKKENFKLVKEPEKADFIIINTCAVKDQTENRMINRIKKLFTISKKKKSKLIVFGCLPKVNAERITQISEDIIQMGPNLEELTHFLKKEKEKFSPKIKEIRYNKYITIIPIAKGCLGNCTFCCTKFARGQLESYSKNEIVKKFKSSLKETKEIWLTAQDTGCYGMDIDEALPSLVKELLREKGNFRIRIGMMDPKYLLRFYKEYISLFNDKRLYRFFHIPVQSGSDKILKLMNRTYKAEDFEKLIKKIKKDLPDATIATDAIVGFPEETDADFQKTVSFIKKTKPSVVNISRYGARKGTKAAEMNPQIHGRTKKERSKILSELCRDISENNSKAFKNKEYEIYVTEKGSKGNFVGRTIDYKAAVIKENKLGQFVKVKVISTHANYLLCETIN